MGNDDTEELEAAELDRERVRLATETQVLEEVPWHEVVQRAYEANQRAWQDLIGRERAYVWRTGHALRNNPMEEGVKDMSKIYSVYLTTYLETLRSVALLANVTETSELAAATLGALHATEKRDPLTLRELEREIKTRCMSAENALSEKWLRDAAEKAGKIEAWKKLHAVAFGVLVGNEAGKELMGAMRTAFDERGLDSLGLKIDDVID